MANVLIAFGANLGVPQQTFQKALEKLSNVVSNVVSSDFYQTEPHYDKPGSVAPQITAPPYINAAFTASTTLAPDDLLTRMLAVEVELGRIRPDASCAPRTIDLDLLLYDDCIINTDTLVLPHPRMHQRNFVLIPAAQIAPNWVHPVMNKSIQQLAQTCSDPLFIRKISEIRA